MNKLLKGITEKAQTCAESLATYTIAFFLGAMYGSFITGIIITVNFWVNMI